MPGKGSSAGGADVRQNQQLQAAADQHIGDYQVAGKRYKTRQEADRAANADKAAHLQHRITYRGVSIN
jgi:hypothetical protein